MRTGNRRRPGFTLVEAAICSVVVALMGVAAGSAVAASGRAREELRVRAQANAAADWLMAEIVGKAFEDPQTPTAPIGLDDKEIQADRSTLDDMDDYDGLRLSPIVDVDGNVIGAKSLEAAVDVSRLSPESLERSIERTGLLHVRVQILREGRVVSERSMYCAQRAEEGL